MARVLVVEDREQERASTLLSAEGFVVVTAVDGTEAIDGIRSFAPDVVLIEAAGPDERVLDLCRAIHSATPMLVVLLCGPCSETEVLAAFSAGVDSVVTEPVGSHELVARVRALLRRRPAPQESADDRVVVGPIVLDRARRELLVLGELVAVPPREFDIAEMLMRAAGRVVARRSIVRELWGTMRDTKSLDVQVGRLRTRLAVAGAGPCIETVRGVGFRFSSADEISVRAPALAIDLVSLEQEHAALEESAPA